MMKLQEKAQAQIKQIVGQMIGDDKLVSEGREQQRRAEQNVSGRQRPKDKASGEASRKPSRDPAPRKGPVLD
ncbi:MAG TPA: hypothetical protein VKT76_05955 [Bradyrhizobium sp.]|nr:hypothetical protein [Bradyrhizobium sp.]